MEMTGQVDVGDEVKRWREKAQLTQAQLAAKIGVSLVTVSRWENGRAAPSAASIAAIMLATKGAVAIRREAARAPIYGVAERLAALEDKVATLEAALATALGSNAAAKREALAALGAGEEVALDAEAAAQRGREKDAQKRRQSA